MVATRSKTAPGPRPRLRADLAAHPSEEELITSFLRPRVVSGGSGSGSGSVVRPCAPFIHDADVYSAGPAALTGRLAPAVASSGDSAWYLFSAVRSKTRDGQRKARTVDTGDGCWHSEAGTKPVVVEEGAAGRTLVGHRQGFSFVTKVDGRRVRSGWLMVELRLDGAGADDVVLCKIYFSPRARASALASASASAAAAASGPKRKAADAHDKNPANSARRRRRGPPTEAEAEAGTPTANAEAKNTRSRGLADQSSTMADDPDALWTDDSTFSWWMRNKDWCIEQYSIVDRTDEEIQKTYKLDEYLGLLKHHYVDFDCGHSPVLNSS